MYTPQSSRGNTKQFLSGYCSYTANVASSVTRGVTGTVQWHAVFFKHGAQSTDVNLFHTVGRLTLLM